MPRSREFEPNQALNQAMLLFWRKGYLETSLDDLVHVTRVSRYGFYSAFGDKHELFIKAMDHYSQTVIHPVLSQLETPEAALAEIHSYFDRLRQALETPQGQMGCLIGNTAMELAGTDEEISARVTLHFDRMRSAFRNALDHALQKGELADMDSVAYANYLVGISMGFLVYLRSGSESQAVKHFLQTALVALQKRA